MLQLDVPREGPVPQNIPLDILHEDESIVVVNKPAGMIVHPAKGHWDGTLAGALAYHFGAMSQRGGPTRPGIVHRLDRDTSGVIVVAKNDQAHDALAAQFKARTVEKQYLAIVVGVPQFDRDVIDQPIGNHPKEREAFEIGTMRGLLGDHTNTSLQLAMAAFIDEGHLSMHLRTLRRLSRERRDALVAAVRRHVPPWARLGPTAAGTFACLHLPPAVQDMEVVRRIREQGVLAIALSSTCIQPGRWNALVLGYGAFDVRTIERSVRVIGRALHDIERSGGYQGDGANR